MYFISIIIADCQAHGNPFFARYGEKAGQECKKPALKPAFFRFFCKKMHKKTAG
jgi:hypothetical protein